VLLPAQSPESASFLCQTPGNFPESLPLNLCNRSPVSGDSQSTPETPDLWVPTLPSKKLAGPFHVSSRSDPGSHLHPQSAPALAANPCSSKKTRPFAAPHPRTAPHHSSSDCPPTPLAHSVP